MDPFERFVEHWDQVLSARAKDERIKRRAVEIKREFNLDNSFSLP